MRSRLNLIVTVAYLTICAVVLVGIVASIGITWPWQHPYRLTAVFSGGSGILPKNEVYVDGVKVGRVDGVQAVGGQARVSMTIDDTAALPFYADSSAEVRQKNLLNENYVDISRGTAASGVMSSGTTIPVSRTLTPVSIDQVRDEFGTFNQVMAQLAGQEQQIGGTVQQADLLLQNLDALVGGQAPNLQSTLSGLPGALASTASFLDQSNRVLGAIYPYRDQ